MCAHTLLACALACVQGLYTACVLVDTCMLMVIHSEGTTYTHVLVLLSLHTCAHTCRHSRAWMHVPESTPLTVGALTHLEGFAVFCVHTHSRALTHTQHLPPSSLLVHLQHAYTRRCFSHCLLTVTRTTQCPLLSALHSRSTYPHTHVPSRFHCAHTLSYMYECETHLYMYEGVCTHPKRMAPVTLLSACAHIVLYCLHCLCL